MGYALFQRNLQWMQRVYIWNYIQVNQKNKFEYHEIGQYFLSLISESETHILFRFIKQSKIFKAFISWYFDDYGLQLM